MAARISITPDIDTSKWEIERNFKNARNWKVTNPLVAKKRLKLGN